MNCPPRTDFSTFKRIPWRHRLDAVQEAWVAHLSLQDPARKAHAYRMAELRYERGRILDEKLTLLQDDDQGPPANGGEE
jgi:hypothetical protein